MAHGDCERGRRRPLPRGGRAGGSGRVDWPVSAPGKRVGGIRASSFLRKRRLRWCATCASSSPAPRLSLQEVRTLRGVITALTKGRGRVLARLARERAAAEGVAQRAEVEDPVGPARQTLQIPIIQAPMLGASTSDNGDRRQPGWRAPGSLAAGSPVAGHVEGRGRPRCAPPPTAPFAVNLLMTRTRAAPRRRASNRRWQVARPLVSRPYGLEVPAAPSDFAPDYDRQFEALVRAAPPAASFTFSVLTGRSGHRPARSGDGW